MKFLKIQLPDEYSVQNDYRAEFWEFSPEGLGVRERAREKREERQNSLYYEIKIVGLLVEEKEEGDEAMCVWA